MLWRLRLEAADDAEELEEDPQTDENDELSPDDTDDERTWSPEAVARSIDHMIMHSAHLIRRTRWFCLLSESSLSWKTSEHSGQMRNLIILDGGSVSKRDTLKAGDRIPSPPHFNRSFYSRQKNISLATYDRLRVLTTELRRLISENRPIELRLRPSVILGNEEIAKALRWI